MDQIPGLEAAMGIIFSILPLLLTVLTIWMIIDCIRNQREWYWILIMLFFWGIGAVIYFFVFKWDPSGLDHGFSRRRQIKHRITELEHKIHHLDHAEHYAELGDIHREQGKLQEAKKLYESALERDPDLFDARVHYGYVLLALKDPNKAWTYLEPALNKKPDFEFGHLLWEAARCQLALGNDGKARQLYEQLLARNTYTQAQVEYAELLGKLGDTNSSNQMLRQVIADFQHLPRYQQRKDKKWVKRAHSLLKT